MQHWMRRGYLVVHIQKHRAGNVGALEFFAAGLDVVEHVAGTRKQMGGAIDNTHLRIVQVQGEPVGFDNEFRMGEAGCHECLHCWKRGRC